MHRDTNVPPEAFLSYLLHFHGTRDYFECHEILEDHWKSEDIKNPLWSGLIQLAVSQYHHRRGNFRGAVRLLEKAIVKLPADDPQLQELGVDGPQLHTLLNTLQTRAANQQLYKSVILPLSPSLQKACQVACDEQGLLFGQQSDLTNDSLINRHIERHLSDKRL
ncbi:DUF309 domain-containing protein [Aureibacillus halotolerans]|nr:DUF309 domain-containing protein [Aureibacillus halotolerans]